MRAFVASGGWVAYFNPADEHYRAALAYIGSALERGDVTLVTSTAVLIETVTVLRYREGHHIAARALAGLTGLMDARTVDFHWPDAGLLDRASRIFRKYHDQAFSLTDCLSFALCQSLGITQAVTPDSHFEIMGIARVGV